MASSSRKRSRDWVSRPVRAAFSAAFSSLRAGGENFIVLPRPDGSGNVCVYHADVSPEVHDVPRYGNRCREDAVEDAVAVMAAAGYADIIL
jgi:hypothetical protein